MYIYLYIIPLYICVTRCTYVYDDKTPRGTDNVRRAPTREPRALLYSNIYETSIYVCPCTSEKLDVLARSERERDYISRLFDI